MAERIFWISTVTLIYTYIGYAAWCAVLARLFPIKRAIRDIYPALTLIIPCYNEELVIRDKINNTLNLVYPRDKLQVIIASESTDATNAIASGFASNGVELAVFGQRHGKSALIMSVMPRARGEIIAFSDANIMLHKDSLEKLARNFNKIANIKIGGE